MILGGVSELSKEGFRSHHLREEKRPGEKAPKASLSFRLFD
jgi:hypothetical protein